MQKFEKKECLVVSNRGRNIDADEMREDVTGRPT